MSVVSGNCPTRAALAAAMDAHAAARPGSYGALRDAFEGAGDGVYRRGEVVVFVWGREVERVSRFAAFVDLGEQGK